MGHKSLALPLLWILPGVSANFSPLEFFSSDFGELEEPSFFSSDVFFLSTIFSLNFLKISKYLATTWVPDRFKFENKRAASNTNV